jgi:hypothetical protein
MKQTTVNGHKLEIACNLPVQDMVYDVTTDMYAEYLGNDTIIFNHQVVNTLHFTLLYGCKVQIDPKTETVYMPVITYIKGE